jgi:hypothetical protein
MTMPIKRMTSVRVGWTPRTPKHRRQEEEMGDRRQTEPCGGGVRLRPAVATRMTAPGLAVLLLIVACSALVVAPAHAAKLLSGTFAVDAGREATTTPDVTLLSQVRGATLMRFRNADGVYTVWEPYVVSRAWALSAGDGLKSVEAQFKGVSGTKVTLVDEIVLDTTGPVTTSDSDGLPHRVVTVSFTPVDELSALASTWFRLDGGVWQEGTTTTMRVWHKKSGLPAGAHTLEFYSTDVLGNVGATGAAVVTLLY